MLHALGIRVDRSSRIDDRMTPKMSETGVAGRPEPTGMPGIDAGSNFKILIFFQNFRIKNQDFQDFGIWMGQAAQIGHLKHSLYSDSPGHPIGSGHGPLTPDGL